MRRCRSSGEAADYAALIRPMTLDLFPERDRGPNANEVGTTPDLQCITSLRSVLHRVRGTPYFFSSIKLTCAATMCQPSANLTQVCICRPMRPGAVGRSYKVEATANSRP